MALNKWLAIGRITHDLELKQTISGTAVLTFSIAVDGNFVNKDGERQTYFFNCVAWRKQAEFINRNFCRGKMIAVEASLQTRSYEDKNGSKHTVVEAMVENAYFCGDRQTNGNAPQSDFNNGGGNFTNDTTQTANRGNSDALSDLNGFEEVISDDGIPF